MFDADEINIELYFICRAYDNHNPGTFIMYEGDDGKGNIMQVLLWNFYCN